MKRRIKITIIFFILIGLAYYFFFEIAVPFVAQTNIPIKWNNIPLGQNRIAVHEYLGKPRIEYWDIKGDEWTKKAKRNTIFLNIGYNNDTIATRYRIGFIYRNWFGEKLYYLRRDTI